MTKYKSQCVKDTFKNAQKGVGLVVRTEKNIRIHLCIAVLVLAAAGYFHFSATKFCVLFLTITSVIGAEMVNSAIEFALDAAFHNRYSKLVGMAKDIAAGAVMFNAVVAVMIGIILFLPLIINFLIILKVCLLMLLLKFALFLIYKFFLFLVDIHLLQVGILLEFHLDS